MKQNSSFPEICIAYDATCPVNINSLIDTLNDLKSAGREFVGIAIHTSDSGYYHPKPDDEIVLMVEEDFFDSEYI